MAVIDAADIGVTVRGDVDTDVVHYAQDKVAQLLSHVREPVLFAEVKLEVARDPARERPALSEAVIDIDGAPVRAQVAAKSSVEAVDLMLERLDRRIQRHEGRRHHEGRDLHRNGEHGEHEWRHGDLPSHRPEYFPRPYDERELVKRKSFALEPMSVDEAAFDLDRLGHDFYLFRELTTDSDAVVSFEADSGKLALQQPEGRGADLTGVSAPVVLLPPAPVLHQTDAIERLESGREPFVFFTDPATGRGAVVYRRYDGHWGMITPRDVSDA